MNKYKYSEMPTILKIDNTRYKVNLMNDAIDIIKT